MAEKYEPSLEPVANVVLIGLLDAGLPQTLICKNKTQPL